MNSKRIFLLLVLIFLAAPTLCLAGGRRGIQPPPRLFEPSENTDLTEKETLLFRWGNEGDRSQIREYQFKLYKGAETLEKNMIHTETVSAKSDRLSLKSSTFENGQTYAWQLRGTGSAKTRPAYSVFKVKK